MKAIQKITALLLLAFCFFSCSKDDDKPADKVQLLVKTVDSDDNLTSIYTYNEAKQLTNINRNGTPNNSPINQNLTYNSDGTLAQITNVSDGSVAEKYFYDSTKKLIKKEARDGIDIYTYEYSNNQVTEKYFFTPTAAAYNQVYKIENGNVSELKVYTDVSSANPNGTLSGTFIYTYDDKFRATKSLPKEYLFPENNNNNVLTEKYNSDAVFTYNWQYNAAGYPIKRTIGYVRSYEYQ